MLNATWPLFCHIKIHQSPNFSNSPNLTPSKISHYTVYFFDSYPLSSSNASVKLENTGKLEMIPVMASFYIQDKNNN